MLIDTHAHLDQDNFDGDRPEMIARAQAAGVSTLLSIGVTAETSLAAIKLAEQHPCVFAAVGIQPNYTGAAAAGDWQQIVQLAEYPRVVAIGETGLDRHWDHTPLPVQQDYFDRHLRLSQQTGLPFVVHTRNSDAEVLVMLRAAAQRGPLSGVMHSFTGDLQTARDCLALGLYISFAGMVTFKKSHDLRAVAAAVPADRILVETDSPYLSPDPLRGRRNEPANIVHTAACLAAARGESLAAFAALTTANARRLFSSMAAPADSHG